MSPTFVHAISQTHYNEQMKRKMERTQDIEWHLKLIACCELGSSNAAVILTGA